MKVCVTGTGGFVGQHMASHLDAAGHTVVSVARGEKPASLASAITHLSADLLDPVPISSSLDALVHCAAVIPARCPDAQSIIDQNRLITENIASAAIAAGAQRIVYMSSMAVYGQVSVDVVDDATMPIDPAPYGIAKHIGEEVMETACRAAGISPPVSLRLPGVVGPGSHDNFLSGAMARIRAGEEVAARNPDGPFNNILFVGDLCRFVANLLASDNWPDEPQAVPIAAKDTLTIDGVLRAMFEGSGQQPAITYSDPPGHAFVIDSGRAQSMGYQPRSVLDSVHAYVAALDNAETGS